MVIKGGARGGPIPLATHLERTDTNERVTVRELRGVTARGLRDALQEMDTMGAAADSRRTLYHANIDTRIGEELTEAQKVIAVQRLAARLGMSDQARAVVEHLKHGREHLHVVFLRIDLDRMAAIPDSHNYRKHEEVARELEREFGHERVQGAHAERGGQKRPARTPSHPEMQQAERTGLTPQEAKARVTELWNRADSGKAFAAALEAEGWVLARGDKRDFVILDRAGETHSLAKRIDGARAAQVRERMADVDAASLPNVQEARALQAERHVRPSKENDHSQAHQPQHVTPPVAEASIPRTKPEIVVLKIQPPLYVEQHRPLELAHAPQREAGDKRPQQAGRVVAQSWSEATQRPSAEVENSSLSAKPMAEPEKARERERPAPRMFERVFTVAAEITQRVIDRAAALFERQDAAKPEPSPPMTVVKPSQPVVENKPPPQDRTPPNEIAAQASRKSSQQERKEQPRPTFEQLRDLLDSQSQSRDRDGPEI